VLLKKEIVEIGLLVLSQIWPLITAKFVRLDPDPYRFRQVKARPQMVPGTAMNNVLRAFRRECVQRRLPWGLQLSLKIFGFSSKCE
jgi:hypothetical protein